MKRRYPTLVVLCGMYNKGESNYLVRKHSQHLVHLLHRLQTAQEKKGSKLLNNLSCFSACQVEGVFSLTGVSASLVVALYQAT